ncbi:hypothetical protein ABE47_21060 [Bacillus thuringiensis]|uniref:hypothetical protein n=1 Tax=Bacillus thuringiensis TaxID=1428 RepID=UPI0018CF5431|nr:hypothetical protein [Bacillus thuringiensis]MBG9514538.1 hypothetical protein [Bacillus thuringiensis]MED2871137.1 hypothetical protein [Bacillus thuringiensis]
MTKYFSIEVAYSQNQEQYTVSHMWTTKDNIKEVMKATGDAVRRAYEGASKLTQLVLQSVEPREISEIEYKRHALSREGKRKLNLQKRGII